MIQNINPIIKNPFQNEDYLIFNRSIFGFGTDFYSDIQTYAKKSSNIFRVLSGSIFLNS